MKSEKQRLHLEKLAKELKARGHYQRLGKLAKINNNGEKNGMWKGDKVSYGALHDYIRYHKPKPKLCEDCKTNSPQDLANISGEYKRELNDWKWLCKKCHRELDNGYRTLSFSFITCIGVDTNIRMRTIQYLNGEIDYKFVR